MPKIKMPKSNPSLDMTPMVDLAFLLVTFFMLTATSRIAEPVIVDAPSSQQDKLLPENVIMVTIDERGRTFFNVSSPEVRKKTLEQMGTAYNIKFTEEEKKRFSGINSFGVPIDQLKQYIAMEEPERAAFNAKVKGIPTDSTDNQLANWILYGRKSERIKALEEKQRLESLDKKFVDKKMRFAIKADGKTNFLQVKDVIKIFTKQEIFIFNLITDLEQGEAQKMPG